MLIRQEGKGRTVGELGREPGLLEIMERTGLSSGEIIMAMESARDVESIYQPVYEKRQGRVTDGRSVV